MQITLVGGPQEKQNSQLQHVPYIMMAVYVPLGRTEIKTQKKEGTD